MKATHRRTNRRLFLFASVAFCLMTASLAARTGIGHAQFPIPEIDLSGGKGKAGDLSKTGPIFPTAGYLANDFSAAVFARKAPMVVRYQLGPESAATITLKFKVKKDERSFPISLKPTGNEIVTEVFQLPGHVFPEEPVVATLSVKAENVDQNRSSLINSRDGAAGSSFLRNIRLQTSPDIYEIGSNEKPPDFELYGLGMGEKAVGSMTIGRLSLQPDRVNATQNEKVTYSFLALSDFEYSYAEFERMGFSRSGEPANILVKSVKVGGLRRDESVRKEWNGKNEEGKVSKGRHQLVIRVWYSKKKGGDWTRASSEQRLHVE